MQYVNTNRNKRAAHLYEFILLNSLFTCESKERNEENNQVVQQEWKIIFLYTEDRNSATEKQIFETSYDANEYHMNRGVLGYAV